jgi:glycosyltransferase involved in cell wall biosynthesis
VNSDRGAPATTVIIPTHDHPSTLDLAIASVLEQSVASLELVVIGDGVEDDTRDVLAAIDDPRLRFIDSAKTSSRAELVRHHVLMDARTDYVCYLGDDDLMLEDHVEAMIEELQSVDFAHPLPVYVLPDGGFGAHLTDLSRSECRDWHLHPARNAVSLTGAAHRLDAYRALPFGWREPPADRWSDHYMWQQWFRAPGIRYRTNPRLTVLKFDSSLRGESSSEDRRTEMLGWIRRTDERGFSDWLSSQATAALLAVASRFVVHADHVADVREKERSDRLVIERELEGIRGQVRDLEAALRVQRDELLEFHDALREAREAYADLVGELSEIQSLAAVNLQRAVDAETESAEVKATRTWKLHDRLISSVPMRWLGLPSPPAAE